MPSTQGYLILLLLSGHLLVSTIDSSKVKEKRKHGDSDVEKARLASSDITESIQLIIQPAVEAAFSARQTPPPKLPRVMPSVADDDDEEEDFHGRFVQGPVLSEVGAYQRNPPFSSSNEALRGGLKSI